MVPDGWVLTSLKAVIKGTIKNGFSPKASDTETGYWVLGLGALGKDSLKPAEIKPVTPTQDVLNSLLATGDFLISRSNTPDRVGLSACFKGEVEKCSYPDLMMRFRINDAVVDSGFIEATLKSYPIRNYFKKCAAGSSTTMVKITKPTVEKTPLLLPSLAEQTKIGQILTTWDKAIETIEQLININQAQKKGLMQQFFKAKQKNNLLTEFKLSDYCKVKRGITYKTADLEYKDSDHPLYINMKSFLKDGGYNRKGDKYFSGDYRSEDILKENQLLIANTDITPSGDIIGLPILIPAKHNNKTTLYSHHITALALSDELDKEYFFYLFSSFETRKHMKRISRGTTVRMLDIKALQKTTIKAPSLNEQKRIASILKNTDSIIENLIVQHDQLLIERKSLMQQLLTGKRRVKLN